MNDTPLSVGRLLLKTHELYWEHCVTFVGLLAIPHLPAALPFLIPNFARARGSAAGMALLTLAWALVYLIAWSALIWAIGAALRKEEVGVVLALSHVRVQGLGRLIWTYLFALSLLFLTIAAGMILVALVGVLTRTLGGLLATLVPLAILGAIVSWILRLLFIPQVVVFEGRGGWGAVTRCRELVKGRWLRLLMVLFFFAVLEGVVTWSLRHVPFLRYTAGLLVAPIGAIWVTLLYYERVDAQLLLPTSMRRARGAALSP